VRWRRHCANAHWYLATSQVREIWGDAAVYVDPEEPRQLAAVLEALLDNPQRCMNFGKMARMRARELSPDRTAAAYYQLYQQLMQESPSAHYHEAASSMTVSGNVPRSTSIVVGSRWSDLQEMTP
jgi:hypothetical protein